MNLYARSRYVIIIFLSVMVIGCEQLEQLANPNSLNTRLREAEAELNQVGAAMITDGVRYDSVEVKDDRLLLRFSLLEINPLFINEKKFWNILTSETVYGACVDDFRVLIDAGGTVEYMHYDKNGEFLGTITVTPAKCQQLYTPQPIEGLGKYAGS
jgi:hypothetical protein